MSQSLFSRARERIAAFIAPRRRNAFDAASVDRRFTDWIFATSRSIDKELKGDIRLMRNRARERVRNSPFGMRYQQLIAENVVGPNGIRYQAKNRGPDGALLVRQNASIEDAWATWSLPENCDITRKLSFTENLNLATGTWGTDGEILIRLLAGPPGARFGPFGFKIQLLDPDLLNEKYNQEPMAGLPRISQGVEYDEWGAPTAYHLWSQHPGDGSGGGVCDRIPAEQIIHAFIPIRPGQSRGIPHTAAVLTTMMMIDGFLEAELVAARGGAAKFGSVEDADPQNPSVRDPNAGPASIPVEVSPGSFYDLRGTGAKVVFHNPEHPNGAAPEFVRMCSRYMAIGLGISYSALTGDLSDTNYSSMKVGQQPERDHWRRLSKFVITHVCARIMAQWMKYALLNGQIQGVNEYDASRWLRGTWQPRGFPSPDPLKDASADLMMVAAGGKTITGILAEQGLDIEEVVDERQRELELFEEHGITSVLPGMTIVAGSGDEKDDTNKPPARTLRLAGAGR